MDIPTTISISIIARGAYDLLKKSAQITFSSLKEALNRPALNQEEEEYLKRIVSLLEKIPEDYKKSPDYIENYLLKNPSSSRVIQSINGEGAISIIGDVSHIKNIGNTHTHIHQAAPEKKNI